MDTTHSAIDTASIFVNEQFLPSQYGDQRTKPLLLPEHHLALAVIKQSERDLESPNPKTFHTARDWFLSKDKSWPYSFSSLCDALNQRPATLRRRARRARLRLRMQEAA